MENAGFAESPANRTHGMTAPPTRAVPMALGSLVNVFSAFSEEMFRSDNLIQLDQRFLRQRCVEFNGR